MATLVEGREYGLASNHLSHENKTVVYFKLTDTALKTLEELSKVKNVRTTIQFHGADGLIKIPSHGNQPDRVFEISVSALAGDVNASFDCIQQTSRHGESSLLSVGTMQNRMTVLATDDVFDRTRAKMSKAEEDNKKVCTKEIKPSGRHISTKIRKVLSSASVRAPHLMRKPVPAVPSIPAKGHDILRSSPSPSGLSTSALSNSGLSTSGLSTSNNSVFTHGQNRQSPTVAQLASRLATISSSSRVLTSSAGKQFSGSINMPYRDRIIHLLALKPYKKPELILRLQKDGIREKDKNSLGSVLQQVAVLNKDNSYTLARSAWVDVRQDWPFFTEQDKVLLKKNLQQESRATPTSPAVSPASSNPESPGSSQKRASEESEDMSNPNKKKRISHMDKPPEEEQSVKPALDHQSSPTADRENLDGNTEEASDDKPDYMRKFVQIEDTDQRRNYKQEFNREYVEYRELHEQVDIVARRFQSLRSQINLAEEGSPDFEALKHQVLEEYEAQKSDPKFMDKKDRMNYLHQKLSHIKRLIHDYDQRLQTFDGS